MNTFDFSFLTEYKGLDLNMILISFLLGVVIASIGALYNRMFLGKIVRRIIEKGAFSPEKALSAEQLGFDPKNIFIKFALREKSTFRKTVFSVGDGVQKYYIPEEKRIREEIRYRKKGNGMAGLILAAVIFTVAAVVLLTVIPWLIDSAKNTF